MIIGEQEGSNYIVDRLVSSTGCYFLWGQDGPDGPLSHSVSFVDKSEPVISLDQRISLAIYNPCVSFCSVRVHIIERERHKLYLREAHKFCARRMKNAKGEDRLSRQIIFALRENKLVDGKMDEKRINTWTTTPAKSTGLTILF